MLYEIMTILNMLMKKKQKYIYINHTLSLIKRSVFFVFPYANNKMQLYVYTLYLGHVRLCKKGLQNKSTAMCEFSILVALYSINPLAILSPIEISQTKTEISN